MTDAHTGKVPEEQHTGVAAVDAPAAAAAVRQLRQAIVAVPYVICAELMLLLTALYSVLSA